MRCRVRLAAYVVIAYGTPTCAKAPVATPRALVQALYKDYGKDGRPDVLGQLAQRFFAPRLLKLIQADERVPVGKVGRLDEDPLCDCQDDGGFHLSSITVDQPSTDRATATARFTLGAAPVTIVLDLETINGEWRIADVHNQSIPSLISFLSGTGGPR